MHIEKLQSVLKEKGLKVTPQRVAILEAVVNLHNHPNVEEILAYLREHYPYLSVSVGTVYKVLETLVEKGLLNKVKTEDGIMRYDAVVHHHHHLYCNETNQIQDYEDPELDLLLKDYFQKKQIKNFNITNISLQITGKFLNK